MAAVDDAYDDGRKRGWRIHDGNDPAAPARHECDVVIVGSGAGGGVSAEMLAKAGLAVVIVEAGPLRSSQHFKMDEWEAYQNLYQNGAARQTADGAVNILQGRCVGGGTTVNWMASFRPPEPVLRYWEQNFGVKGLSPEELTGWLAEVETRMSVEPWTFPPNANNALLAKGGAARGVKFEVIARNQTGCADLGYCGMGCPLNAKQSMLVTTIPEALNRGATLLVNTSALRLTHDKGRVENLACTSSSGRPIEVRARHFVLAAGAIGSPALLLRSQAPDPNGRLGKRTFLHPTVVSAALFKERVDPYRGAPQSLYSDHYVRPPAAGDAISFKIEAAPLHPTIFAGGIGGDAEAHRNRMRGFAHTQIAIGLLRDGFHAEAAGGSVQLDADGDGVLHYPLTGYVLEGARQALIAMADLQFAAGAECVFPGHELALEGYGRWDEAKAGLASIPFETHRVNFNSAHVMGGCGMADAPERGVTDAGGRHFQLENVSIHDASLFPTGLGTNPQITIFSLAARASAALAARLTNKPAPRLAEAA
jgi:choline dehydrogenase-like flavoprotein